jgi:two-component system phosphate regulon sensor histidine kinase PhoR
MKRVFPVIIVLITVSLLGLMYLQMSWIQNALLVQKNKYTNEVENAMNGISKAILLRATQATGYNPAMANYYDDESNDIFWSSIRYLSPEDIQWIIKDQLDRNNIALEFEYSIYNKQLGYVISKSAGFIREYLPESAVHTLDRNETLTLYLYIKEPKNYILKRTSWMILTSILFTFVIITAFALTIRTIFRQKKLSEIKSDFINNMTHEFKTPLATISLAVDALNNEKVWGSREKSSYYTGIIKDENTRMFKQVEKILQAAQLEKNELELKLQPVNVHEYIQTAITNAQLQAAEKGGELKANLKATKVMIKADEVHFSNIIFNLLDNAVKYSKEKPKITVETSNNAHNLILKVRDNGIGMNKETLSHIFEKFYRAHTGNLHNVKGFGLGLSYVKAVVDAHGGKIKVDSTVGKGSVFTLEFPLVKK